MDIYDKRNSTDDFLREFCGDAPECLSNHHHIDNALPRNPSEQEVCCFNKVMNNISQTQPMIAATMCDDWVNCGLDVVLCFMIESGNIDPGEIYEAQKTDDLNEITEKVARIGCLEMFKICEGETQRGRHANYDFVLCCAARHGFVDIFMLCEKRGAVDFGSAMCVAAEGGHDNIAKMCKKRGAHKFNDAMSFASNKGHIEVTRLCKEWGANNFSCPAIRAAERCLLYTSDAADE